MVLLLSGYAPKYNNSICDSPKWVFTASFIPEISRKDMKRIAYFLSHFEGIVTE